MGPGWAEVNAYRSGEENTKNLDSRDASPA